MGASDSTDVASAKTFPISLGDTVLARMERHNGVAIPFRSVITAAVMIENIRKHIHGIYSLTHRDMDSYQNTIATDTLQMPPQYTRT